MGSNSDPTPPLGTPAVPPVAPSAAPLPVPQVTRVPLGRDPTMPILLRRPAPPPIAEPVAEALPVAEPPAEPPVSAPSAAADWRGDDRTVVGPATPAPASATTPPANEWHEEWKGDDRTVVTPLAATTPPPVEDWRGDDRTVVGAVAPAASVPAGASEWKGDEATLLGMQPGSAQQKEPGSGTAGSRTPGKTTAPTMDAGWHLAGRKGPLTGSTMDDYELGGVLGEGGMGIVYRAKQISLKRRAAIKVLPSNLAADLRLRARFEAEARTASLLNTPHVVQVFGAGTFGDIVYFAMEFVEGIDLSEIIHAKKEKGELFTPEEAANYVLQSASGLAEAGRHGIVHRDIKPANLMVTNKGVVKIADFGISKVAGELGMTMTGTAVGTPAYCSPEQGRGEAVDPRADIYSLGVVFYELLTGSKPFDGTSANALIYQHNYQEPKLLKELRPELADAYQVVCLKCLMKDPAGRYQDANELVADLERARDGNMSMTAVFQAKFGTGAEAAMAKYLGVNKRWWLKYVIAASFLAIITGGGLYYWSSTKSERQQREQNYLAEVESHKIALRELDSAKPVPTRAADDLKWLAANAGSDPDLPRWQAKYARVAKSQTTLAALDAPTLPSRALRDQGRTTLTTYVADVGKNGADVQRWEARLAAADQRDAALRGELHQGLDSQETLSAALRTRVAPAVAELTALAGAKDPDAARWTQRLAETDNEIAERRKLLAALDAKDLALTEGAASSAKQSLTRLAQLVDPQDADLLRWSGVIAAHDQGMVSLRRTLGTELDQERVLTVAQQNAIRPYLERYHAQVPASNPQLVAWTRRLDESLGRVTALRKALGGALDGDQALPSETALNELGKTLADYAALAAPDDADLVRWSTRVRQERDAIDGDRAVLAELDKTATNQLTLVSRAACEKSLARLDTRGAIAADRKGAVQRRIAEEKASEEALRADLKARSQDSRSTAATETLAQLKRLELIAGQQDPDVSAWRTRLAQYFKLYDALKPLDRLTSIPAGADENLKAFSLIVGDDAEQAVVWRSKLVRVNQLTAALKGTEDLKPLPSGALANATELVDRWVGAEDVQARDWLAKAKRVTALRARLATLFGDAAGTGLATDYVLPADSGARRDVDELIALTGDREPVVRHWRYRAQVLAGPGKPAWAAEYGRDAFGPWAELTVGETKQRLRYIPAGTFTIGSPVDEAGRDEDEPQVPGILLTKGLWLADSECTQKLWHEVMGSNPSRFRRTSDAEDHPVERISWEDTQAFCKALAPRLNVELQPRLPTEAEWEYAARAGQAGCYFDATGVVAADHLSEVAWSGLLDGTRGVRRRAPNRLGLFDMHGNVWEWCQDRYGTYSAVEVQDPVGRQEETRVARGGSWADPSRTLRVANRLALRPELRTLYTGVRFALPVTWPAGSEPKPPGSDDELSAR